MSHAQRGTGVTLTTSHHLCANGWLYMPVPVVSRAVEIAHGQNPLANKSVLFSVGKQEFRGVVWQEAHTLGI